MLVISVIRELLGNGTIAGIQILGSWYNPALIMILPAGAFVLIGYMMGGVNIYLARKESKKAKESES